MLALTSPFSGLLLKHRHVYALLCEHAHSRPRNLQLPVEQSQRLPCTCLFSMMLYRVKASFHLTLCILQLSPGCLTPLADIAAKLETMKFFKDFFFKHTYYSGCLCFCLVADVQLQGVMGVVMWLVITPHTEGVTSFFSWWILSFQFIVFSLPQQCCQSTNVEFCVNPLSAVCCPSKTY